MALTQQQKDQAALQAHFAAGGKMPGPMPDGPKLDCFKAQELAQAIEHEVQKPGTTKIRLDMDRVDAQALASYLRRAILMGV